MSKVGESLTILGLGLLGFIKFLFDLTHLILLTHLPHPLLPPHILLERGRNGNTAIRILEILENRSKQA